MVATAQQTPIAVPPIQTVQNLDTNVPSGGLPDWIVFGLGVLLVGAIGEILYHINPTAGYGFILLVVLGFAASGGRVDAVTNFFKGIGIISI